MRVFVAGRQIDVGDALRQRIEADLAAGVEKYFNRATDAHVTVAKNHVGFEVDCDVRLASGISLQAQGDGADAQAAFSAALAKIEKRVRRYKKRLRNHHNGARSPLPAEGASAYVLSAPAEDDGSEDASGGHAAADDPPLVIAETKIPVKTMTVSMAVLQLGLVEAPALMFRNAAHGGLNLVYRRSDGNVGWVDPEAKTP
jgi:ribosomal subunit interface protein